MQLVLLLAQVLLVAGLWHLLLVAVPLAVVLLEEVDWQMQLVLLLAQVLLVAGLWHLLLVAVPIVPLVLVLQLVATAAAAGPSQALLPQS
jgi:hypothetical protein